MTEVDQDRLWKVAAAQRLLVASDLDGTLAPIAPRPEQVRPAPGARRVLTALTRLPDTSVAVVSGRSLGDLDRILHPSPRIRRVGSHGAEDTGAAVPPTSAHERELLGRVLAVARGVAAEAPGTWVEAKPFGFAFHYRAAEPDVAAAALVRLEHRLGGRSGLWIRPGKRVLDVSVRPLSKAAAIRRLRDDIDPGAVIYLGDDHADEEVFASLGRDDLGIRVGEGATAAAASVEAPEAAVSLLRSLLLARRATRRERAAARARR
ncbi:MAG: trehalose-phosphatase [Acidimicrobiales bacterium]|nr:trehalose-phosphatase [Acidimicrobiales bacterium]